MVLVGVLARLAARISTFYLEGKVIEAEDLLWSGINM